jgi:RNA polymerase sigma-70 factor (ECF subfamily)
MTAVNNRFAGINLASAFVDTPTGAIAKMAAEPKPPSDVLKLTARMSRGDETAFREFYELYFHRLLRYLIVVTRGQEEIAQEALQVAFVRIARHVRTFDSETGFWNWLAVVARNCAADEFRKRNRHRNMLARFFQDRAVDADLKGSEKADLLLKFLEQEMAGLPKDERALIEGKYFAERTVGNLADERQMSEKAMESRLLRIRRNLRAAVLGRLKNAKTD